MHFFRWRRARKIRRTLRYVRRLQRALKAIPEARKSLKENEDYQPVCMGGMEDKVVWTEQARSNLYFWLHERDYLFKKLGVYSNREHRLSARLMR